MDRGSTDRGDAAASSAGPVFVPFGQLAAQAEVDPSSATVLNVTDDDANRSTVSRALRRAELRVEEAATAAEAFRLLARKPDLIILDVDLPDLSGFEVCRRIKANPAFAPIPVLQLSAKLIRTEDKVQGLEGGADGYLTQPFEPPELVATVKSLLRLRWAERKAEEAAHQWQTTFDAIRDGVCLTDAAGKILCCNVAFVRILGLTPAAPLGKPFLDLFRAWSRLSAEELSEEDTAAGIELCAGQSWYQVKSDPVLDAGGRPAGAVHILSELTDRQRALAAEKTVQRSSERIQQLEQEVKALERLASQSSTGQSGVKTPALRQSSPDVFAELADSYGALMDLALEQRCYKVTHNLPARLDSLGERLGALRAGPRDVIEMHNTALAARRKGAAPSRLQAYLEEGRFLLLELMGGLVHHYRRHALEGHTPAAPQSPLQDSKEAARE